MRQASRLLSVFFIGIGLIMNPWLLSQWFSPKHSLQGLTTVKILLFQIFCLSVGIWTLRSSEYHRVGHYLKRLCRKFPVTAGFVSSLLSLLVLAATVESTFFFVRLRSQLKQPNSDITITAADHSTSFVEPHPRLGYRLKPNFRGKVRKFLGQHTIYDVTYETDSRGRRVTPISRADSKTQFLLFSGCSFTFGEGVAAKDNLPTQLGRLTPNYHPYNYGVPGYGTHQVLTQMEEIAREDIAEKTGTGVYLMIDAHISRNIGSMKTNHYFDQTGPYYHLRETGTLEFRGTFAKDRPFINAFLTLLSKSSLIQYWGKDILPRGEDGPRLTEALVTETRNQFMKKFRSPNFFVVIFPGQKKAAEIGIKLQERGIRVLDYSDLWPASVFKDYLIPQDEHPNAEGYRKLAHRLNEDLRPPLLEAHHL